MVKVIGSALGGQSELSVTTGAVVTLTVPAGANAAVIENGQGGVIRYTTTGVNPSSVVGNRLPTGSFLIWIDPLLDYRALLLALKLIAESQNSTINVQYYVIGGVA